MVTITDDDAYLKRHSAKKFTVSYMSDGSLFNCEHYYEQVPARRIKHVFPGMKIPNEPGDWVVTEVFPYIALAKKKL